LGLLQLVNSQSSSGLRPMLAVLVCEAEARLALAGDLLEAPPLLLLLLLIVLVLGCVRAPGRAL
jgi:hypothetical protein